MNGKPRRCMPPGEWPPYDQAAWQRALQSGSVLDDRGGASHWSEASRNTAIQGYGRWLQYLLDNHFLEPDNSGIGLISRSQIADFTMALEKDLSTTTVVIQLEQLYHAARVMAPQNDWKWLRTYCTHIKNRNRYAERRLEQLVDVDRLLDLGRTLMMTAEQELSSSTRRRPVQYRDGLIIALLASRPLRRRTFAKIRIGHQLRQVGNDWWLVFPPEDLKNRRPLEFTIPSSLTPHLERYLEHYRPQFPVADSDDHLWQSIQGPMTAGGVYQSVIKRTRDAFGFSVPMHQFRHAAATTISRQDPGHVFSIAPVLGHATLDMAYRHYIVAGGTEAARDYQKMLHALRNNLKVHRRSRRGSH